MTVTGGGCGRYSIWTWELQQNRNIRHHHRYYFRRLSSIAAAAKDNVTRQSETSPAGGAWIMRNNERERALVRCHGEIAEIVNLGRAV